MEQELTKPPIWVTAIMPCYNHAEFVRQAMDSAQSQVDELIIVDDASTDYSVREIYRSAHRYDTTRFVTRAINKGAAEAINIGWQQCKESPIVPPTFPKDQHWVTWISADNVMHDDWIGTLESNITPTTGAVYGGFLKFNWPPKDDGTIPGQYRKFTPHTAEALISTTRCYYGPAFLIRSDVWDRTGPHRGKVAHDYDHWLRIEEVCWELGLDIVGVDQVLCFFRIHENRTSVRNADTSLFESKQFQKEARHRRAMQDVKVSS